MGTIDNGVCKVTLFPYAFSLIPLLHLWTDIMSQNITGNALDLNKGIFDYQTFRGWYRTDKLLTSRSTNRFQ